ncbi:MAG: M20/M25/M40 family metallo-hydrolase [Acidaminococcaceae bacterium]|nr:M20/M25/M40 family metallo-hydrolase [Acidaminococcaceae bacterium]
MKDRIIDILQGLMACAAVTNTEKEIAAELWMLEFFRKQPYFKKYPELCGTLPIPGDALNRSAVWAMVKPSGICEKLKVENLPAVVFMGHHDVVSADVYGEAAPWAFDLDEIASHLNAETLSAEAYTDLLSGEWLFGRGSCDMLGGTAVQMALLTEQAEAALHNAGETNEGQGALLFISVPDEESFSVGMRGSLPLLEQLKDRYHLDYCLAVCSEPNQKLPDGKTQVVYSGSIGKLLPVILVQGKLVQVGSYREGVNPVGILSRIVAATEGDETFAETFGNEVSVPPVWMYTRDLKEGYDFSLPKRAAGYCNVLTFRKTPAQVMAYFLGKIKRAVADMGHSVKVMTWVTLWQQAKQHNGFKEFWQETERKKEILLQNEHKTFPEVTLWMMQQTLDFLNFDKPVVLFGFAPPYYPAVRSEDIKDAERFEVYKKVLSAMQDVIIKSYFPGVSDCSYCGLSNNAKNPVYQANTPLWGPDYQFDMEALARLQIPFFLFGPWGKDLHQIGERVNRNSLTEEYPEVLRKLLHCVWYSLA